MEREHIVYGAYLLFFIIFMGLILATPILSFTGDTKLLYTAFSYTCHQKISRSVCIFKDAKGYFMADCLPQNGVFISDANDRTQIRTEINGVVGYKMPVCARDLGLYIAMLAGGLTYPFVRKLNSKEVWPAIWLVVAIIPLGIDGTVQLLSELGFLPFVYESTNLMRMLTGAIAGFVATFYAIPLLINLITPNGPKENKKTANTKRELKN